MPACARRNPVSPHLHRHTRSHPLAPPPPSAPSRTTRTTCMRMCSRRSPTSRHRRHAPRTHQSAWRAAAQTPIHAQAALRRHCGRSRFGGGLACMTPFRRTAAVPRTPARCAGLHTMGPMHRAGRHTHACVLEALPQTPAARTPAARGRPTQQGSLEVSARATPHGGAGDIVRAFPQHAQREVSSMLCGGNCSGGRPQRRGGKVVALGPRAHAWGVLSKKLKRSIGCASTSACVSCMPGASSVLCGADAMRGASAICSEAAVSHIWHTKA